MAPINARIGEIVLPVIHDSRGDLTFNVKSASKERCAAVHIRPEKYRAYPAYSTKLDRPSMTFVCDPSPPCVKNFKGDYLIKD